MAFFKGILYTFPHTKNFWPPMPPWGEMNFPKMTPTKKPKMEINSPEQIVEGTKNFFNGHNCIPFRSNGWRKKFFKIFKNLGLMIFFVIFFAKLWIFIARVAMVRFFSKLVDMLQTMYTFRWAKKKNMVFPLRPDIGLEIRPFFASHFY